MFAKCSTTPKLDFLRNRQVSLKQNKPFNNMETKTVQSESTGKSSSFSRLAAYSIHVEGLLDESWSERLAGMNIKTVKRKNLPLVTTLSGPLA